MMTDRVFIASRRENQFRRKNKWDTAVRRPETERLGPVLFLRPLKRA